MCFFFELALQGITLGAAGVGLGHQRAERILLAPRKVNHVEHFRRVKTQREAGTACKRALIVAIDLRLRQGAEHAVIAFLHELLPRLSDHSIMTRSVGFVAPKTHATFVRSTTKRSRP